TGSATPTNWAAVDGVFTDAACTVPASNGDTGWLYALVQNVPFNQDSATLNTIRFRATDIAGNQGTQDPAESIQIDNTNPEGFKLVSPVGWVSNKMPQVIIMFNESTSGVNVSSVEYAYSVNGSLSPSNWMNVDTVYTDAELTNLAQNGDTGILYAVINAVPFNQDSRNLNTIRLRASDMVGNRGILPDVFFIRIDTKEPDIENFIYSPESPRPGDLLTIQISLNISSILSGVNVISINYTMSDGWIQKNFIKINDSHYYIEIQIDENLQEFQFYITILDNAGNIRTIGTSENPYIIQLSGIQDLLLIIILIAIGIMVGIASVIVYRRRGRERPGVPIKIKKKLKDVSPRLTEQEISSKIEEDKKFFEYVEHFSRDNISVDNVAESSDIKAREIVQKPIQILSNRDLEYIQSEVFKELSETEKMEILMDMAKLSEREKDEFISKMKKQTNEFYD
ncbi:MAG: hypothetical protein ACTSYB_05250, partial [Candidatus Helarchaeota archaeon]